MRWCKCEVCKYGDAYAKAVRTNNKKFLMAHYETYISMAEDLDVARHELAEKCQELKDLKETRGKK